MIIKLRIQNVALVDFCEVGFLPGLNVLTGETGAGKSIIVDSLNFLLGGRAGRDFIRSGADFALVEGLFSVDKPLIIAALDEMGVSLENGQIMLYRQMQATSGKSLCRINGRVVTARLLKDAAQLMVDLHSQHETQQLLDPIMQLNLLDEFIKDDLARPKAELEELFAKYRATDRALKALLGPGLGRDAQIDMLKFQLGEIDAAKILPGEEEDLLMLKAQLGSLENLRQNTADALSCLDGNIEQAGQNSAIDQLARALKHVQNLASLDSRMKPLVTRLRETHTTITDIVHELHAYLGKLESNPVSLDDIEARLHTMYRIKQKFGPTINDVFRKREEISNKLDALINSDDEILRLKEERSSISREITGVCDDINTLRSQCAKRIESEISTALEALGMKDTAFTVDISRKSTFSTSGNCVVEFMVSPNPGEPARPLRKIASGGEMSRIMLAIKTITAQVDHISTIIFDEIDTGVSGRTAWQVAQKLLQVSRHRQLLCITHLPQIASMADAHFLIEKTVVGKKDMERTITKIIPLEFEDTITELARLIGGAQITTITLQAAAEMKTQARNQKLEGV